MKQQASLVNIAELNPLIKQQYDTPVLVIYPRHPNRSALIAYLLDQVDTTIHYYALGANDTSLGAMLENLLEDPQFPSDFGRHTRNALSSTTNATTLAEAFSDDLADLHNEDYIFMLDQLDRLQYSDTSAYDDFFVTLSQNLPTLVRLVINGRELNRHPWNKLVQMGLASAVGDSNAIKGGMFDYDTNLGVIEFYALSGDIRVLSDGFQVTSWDGALPRNLCYYFIENERVTRNQIFETFWPHLGIKEATNVFHVTKRKISEKLGYDITAYSSGFYVPSNRVTIHYDAREFENAYEAALNGPSEVAPSKWYRAASLYRHPYLEGLDMPWVNTKREKLQDYYVQTLIELGRYYEKRNQPNDALGYYLRAVAEKPEREDVHRSIMTLYHDHQDKRGVVTQYEYLERELKRNFNIAPSKETRALYKLYTSS